MANSVAMRQIRRAEPFLVLPVGTVTFLLADIEGSVRLWESDRAAMTLAVRRFDAVLGEEIARHHGVRPVEQGEGDSFVVAFVRADDAVRGAVAIQHALANEPWPGGLRLRVRMALHTGDAQLRDEGNYVGNAINRAGRLRSLAHGGQILVSPTTFELVADNMPGGCSLRDLGLQRIRDLARPLRVHQVTAADLESTFPPLRSLDVLTERLPVTLATFIGRESELRDVAAKLSSARLLTLTGAGGSGKTRLAVEVARGAAENYPDGVRFADLSRMTVAGDVVRAVAEAFDRSPQEHQPVIETLVEHLRSKRALLLLDNCEHVLVPAAELTSRLLQACPMLTIFATSREPLRIEGELAWRVPSMSTPGRTSSEPLTTYDAVRLFIDRAGHARPNFTVTNDNAPAVAVICQALDGIPLAIELAAARVRVMTVEQIATGLADRFHLLRGGAQGDLPRQQTLAASVAWSHDLLNEREQAVLRRLGVFASGFTLDAAETVCSGDDIDAYEVLDLLSGLVDKSLVIMEERDRSARFRLLETIRQFTQQQLAATGETAATRERHARWFADFVLRATDLLGGPDQVTWFGRLEDEHDNIRGALGWAVGAPAPDIGVPMAAALAWFWNVHGHWQEAVRWIDRVRDTAQETDAFTDLLDLFGPALGGMVGDATAAIPAAELAAERSRLAGDHGSRAWALNVLGKYTALVNLSQGSAYLEEAAVEAAAAGDGTVLADSLAFAALVDLAAGNTTAAVARSEQALASAMQAGNSRGQLVALNSLAAAAIRRGDLPAAAAVLDQAMDLASDVGDRLSMAIALLLSGHVELMRGDHQRADELFREGVDVGKQTGSSFLADAGSFLAVGALAAGDPARAVEIDRNRERSGHPTGNWLHFLSPRPAVRAEALMALGDLPGARASVDETLALAVASGKRFGMAHALLARGRVSLADGRVVAAETDAHAALADFRAADAVADTLSALDLLATCAAAADAHLDAARLIGATSSFREAHGWARWSSERAAHEDTVAGLRAALGPDAFELAVGMGTMMSLDDACAYVTRGRGQRKRPTAGWGSLTPTELSVVRLIASGASNREIAAQLFVSPNTVKTHLAHVFAKLGVATRAQLAAQTTRRHLFDEE